VWIELYACKLELVRAAGADQAAECGVCLCIRRKRSELAVGAVSGRTQRLIVHVCVLVVAGSCVRACASVSVHLAIKPSLYCWYVPEFELKRKKSRASERPWRRSCAGRSCASSTLFERESEGEEGLSEGSPNIKHYSELSATLDETSTISCFSGREWNLCIKTKNYL
jgi:hypothetical protein